MTTYVVLFDQKLDHSPYLKGIVATDRKVTFATLDGARWWIENVVNPNVINIRGPYNLDEYLKEK